MSIGIGWQPEQFSQTSKLDSLRSIWTKIQLLFRSTPDLVPICFFSITLITTVLIAHLLLDMYVGTISVGMSLCNGIYVMLLYWLLTAIDPATRSPLDASQENNTNVPTYSNKLQSEQFQIRASVNSESPPNTPFSPTSQLKPLLSHSQSNKSAFTHDITKQPSTKATFPPAIPTDLPDTSSYLDLQSLLTPTPSRTLATTIPFQQTTNNSQPLQSAQFQQNKSINNQSRSTTPQAQFLPNNANFKQNQLAKPPSISNPSIPRSIPQHPSTVSNYTAFSPQHNPASKAQNPGLTGTSATSAAFVYPSTQLLNQSFTGSAHLQQSQQQPIHQHNHNNPLPPPPTPPSFQPHFQPAQTTHSHPQTSTTPAFNINASTAQTTSNRSQISLSASQLMPIPQYPPQQLPQYTFQYTPQTAQSQQPFQPQPTFPTTATTQSTLFSPPLTLTTPSTSTLTTMPQRHQISLTSLYSPSTCPLCLTTQPARTYHCVVCRQCSHLRNHHCFLINNCIAKKNLPLYLHFLIFLLFNGLLIAYLTCYYFWYYTPLYNVPPPHYTSSITAFVYLSTLSVILIIFSVKSLSQSAYTLFINLTAAERDLIRKWVVFTANVKKTQNHDPTTATNDTNSITSPPSNFLHLDSILSSPIQAQSELGALSLQTDISTTSPQLSISPNTIAFAQSPTSLTDLLNHQTSNFPNNNNNNNNQLTPSTLSSLNTAPTITTTSTITTTTHFLNTTHSSPFSPNSQPFAHSNIADELPLFNNPAQHANQHTLPYQRHWAGALMTFFDLDVPFLLSMPIFDVITYTLFSVLSTTSSIPASASSSVEINNQNKNNKQQRNNNTAQQNINNSTLPSIPNNATYKSKVIAPTTNTTSSLASISLHSSYPNQPGRQSPLNFPQPPDIWTELYTLWILPLSLLLSSRPTQTSSSSSTTTTSTPTSTHIAAFTPSKLSLSTRFKFTWSVTSEWCGYHFRWALPLSYTIAFAPIYTFCHRALVWTDEMIIGGSGTAFFGGEDMI